ncbi:hypothetical protein HNP84_006679 [Thermocatellispora tengchongensis]|uniref:DUF1772 domain-containing protein n=1 Tax=Thermocatellispora tengchongensis TaxID=1073253 RepID=A0A840PIJ5_9ACTN|nr:hypothetical protein [Thermocatellispora tengchongensis]MBB5136927.1 hypothetical protein [Thermocatellispora tengchongensis]
MDALTRYRLHADAVLVLIAWWGFGNLYEAIVVMPWLWHLPPGSLPAEFEPGSPVLYFLPAGVALLTLAWTLVIRVSRDPGRSRRAVLRTAVLITISAAGTGILVSAVNPTFRDPAASVADVHSAIVMWEAGNAVRLVLAATAAVTLYRWRAHPEP